MYPEPMRPTQLIEDFVESTFILLSQDPDIRELSKSIQTWTGYPPLNTITVNWSNTIPVCPLWVGRRGHQRNVAEYRPKRGQILEAARDRTYPGYQ